METPPRPTPFGAIGQPLPAFEPSSAAAPSEPVPDSFSFAKPRDPRWYQHAVFYAVSYTHLTLPTILLV